MKGENFWLVARPIAHRGLHDRGRGIIENSLSAARAAAGRGYAIECDVRLSRDGSVFVFHDDLLDRLTEASGPFARHDSHELARIALRGGDEAIPSLAKFLATVAGAVPLILELKSDFSGDLALAGAVAAALADYGGLVALKSFDPALIAALRARAAPWPLGIVAQSDYDGAEFVGLPSAQWEELTRFTHAAATRPDFLSWRATDLPAPVVEFARAVAAIPVMTWTIRSPHQADAARKHADQIIFEGFEA
ncbi:glycerophosphodiester phosphodiesterase [Rhodoblastus acidophilus]|uniref:Glycerophosphodiester phosphodiesterase n=1 Tax=Candidatus Rhodoblastus alkanivorans TaxID=2954117 RepID=A0ABS9Z6V6_9HYPH|nr:glycerophosphodiester phosphodiesterase family protein [Candidatus Rhodoblastus alkanivorans]MCI4678390.1 glycerophosphodiester phosphodiesterase [Candidatus Rhodoblastus alkanivorans]MCI4682937.1 glycerophosphodiester phosphodiesterase [Candidatus Rhodoblastus alkanivorans]MDI4640247.1 glycerophosphodiester phosphodiesterase [Rhodoblastus acidophilus]